MFFLLLKLPLSSFLCYFVLKIIIMVEIPECLKLHLENVTHLNAVSNSLI